MKDISELMTAPNGCFAFVDSASTVSINYDHPDGIKEFTDFEAYKHPKGTVLRFPNPPEYGLTPWNLRVVLDSEKIQMVQWGTYENNFDVWENRPLNPHSFLVLMKSQDIRNSVGVLERERRCDKDAYGGVAYHTTDGIKPTIMDLNIIKNYNASLFHSVLNVNGITHIATLCFHGIYMSWRNWPMVVGCSRTLSGALRQASEWRDLYIAGLSTEDLAKDCFYYFEALGITQDMVDELKLTEVMMPVERFMRGYGNPRHGFTETGVLPDSLRNHLMKQLTYKDLSVLEAKHPSHPEFSDSLKAEEKSKHQLVLYEYMVELMPWVNDPSTVTVKMIEKEILREKDSYSAQNGVENINPVYTPLIEKAISAVRYYNATQQSS